MLSGAVLSSSDALCLLVVQDEESLSAYNAATAIVNKEIEDIQRREAEVVRARHSKKHWIHP